MKNFILLGAAGYVASKHLKAIKDVGGNLLAICDPHDSVGIIDSYFPDCKYFKDFERLDRFVYKLKDKGINIDYVSIATPNYFHDTHCRWALRMGADAICEKPLTLFEKNVDSIQSMENKNRVHPLYQLRYHSEAIRLKNFVKDKQVSIEIDYNTPRGEWYEYSWKGDIKKSGGIETNIGCHLFDLLTYSLGYPLSFSLKERSIRHSIGEAKFKNGKAIWKLSTKQGKPNRIFKVNGENFEFNSGFTELHTTAYKNILANTSPTIEDFRLSIRLCEQIRSLY